MNIQKIETFLPYFEGFYCTKWEYKSENVLYCINQEREEKRLNSIEWDVLDIDYKEYENDIVKCICEILEKELKPFVLKIDFQNIINPKEYNFYNDSANVLITVDTEKIREYIYCNLCGFMDYLKRVYTGCDGYIPFYSNNFKDWTEETKDFSDFSINKHYLGSILEFICKTENVDDFSLYEEVKEQVYEDNYILNYGEALTCFLCSECSILIEDKKTISDCKKYFSIVGKYPSKIHCLECIENN